MVGGGGWECGQKVLKKVAERKTGQSFQESKESLRAGGRNGQA